MQSALFDAFKDLEALDGVLAAEGVPPLLAKLAAARLRQLAYRHRRLSREDEDLAVGGVEKEITQLLDELGVGIQPHFHGDYRGPTVRLRLPSGRANGFLQGLWIVYPDG